MLEASAPPADGIELPFEPFEPLQAERLAQLEAAALEANATYVEEILEAHAFCPFSREGRRSGATACEILYPIERSIEPLLAAMLRAAEGGYQVSQLALPGVEVEPERWSRFCQELTAAGNARIGARPTFAVAPLHPALPYRRDSGLTIVPLLRRAPDPTIQWVRLDALASIYEGRRADAEYVEPERIQQYLQSKKAEAPRARKPLYDRIAEANHETTSRLGFEAIEASLEAIHQRARARYREILAG
ncbi:MAG: hypothetical protein OEY14_00565 [Myxococcales bacterium]|nr:hypothetical protein [Myxococcales bacterium]